MEVILPMLTGFILIIRIYLVFLSDLCFFSFTFFSLPFLPCALSLSMLASLKHFIHNQGSEFQHKWCFCKNLFGQLGPDIIMEQVFIRS